MKKIFSVLLVIILSLFIVSCTKKNKITYTVSNVSDLEYIYEIGTENVDFTKYFKIIDSNNKEITVKNEYLDLSNVDFSKKGSFTVTLNYEGSSATITILVTNRTTDINEILNYYKYIKNRNYVAKYSFDCTSDPESSFDVIYTVDHDNMTIYDSFYETTDCLYYFNDVMYYAFDYNDGYFVVCENDEDYEYYIMSIYLFDGNRLNEIECIEEDGYYKVTNTSVASEILFNPEDENDVYDDIKIYVENGLISKITAVEAYTYDDETTVYNVTIEISDYNTCNVDINKYHKYYDNEPTETKEPINNDEELIDAINAIIESNESNYKLIFDVNCTNDSEDSWKSTYRIDGYNFEYIYDYEDYTYTDCIYYFDDMAFYAYEEEAGSYEVYDSESNEFNNLIFYLDYYDFYSLLDLEFTKVGDHYEANDSVKAGEYVFGGNDSDDVYTSFNIYLTSGKISKITASNTFSSNGVYNYEYTLTFSDYGQISINIDDYHKYYNGSIPTCEPVDNDEELVKAFNVFNKNYNFQLEYVAVCSDDEYSWNTLYKVNNTDMEMIFDGDDNYIDCYYMYDEEVYYAHQEDDGSYSVYSWSDEDFIYLLDYIDYYDFYSLSNIEFTKVDDHYEAKDPNKAAEYVLGYYDINDNFKSFNVYLEDGAVCKIEASEDYTYEDVIYKYEYTLTLTKYSEIEINVDKYHEYYNNLTPVSGDGFKAEFTDVSLSTTSDSNLNFTTTSKANSFDNNRGVQYLQNAGQVELVSQKEVSGITEVTIICASNADKGMNVKVFIGSTELSCKNNLCPKTNFDVNTTLVFTSTTELSGKIKITLVPNQDSKSMYIKSIVTNGNGKSGSSEMIERQSYNPETFDNKTIDDALFEFFEIPYLPNKGEYKILVIPVQFSDVKFDNDTLADLQKAFNGTSIETGYESVSSYYYKASYGNVDITFDILDPYTASKNRSYYNSYFNKTDYYDGSQLLLIDALTYYDSTIDYTKYDYNNDGAIDGVYIIYAGDVDYESDSSIWWAFTTYYYLELSEYATFDGLDVYNFTFAGADFMYEGVDTEKAIEGIDIIDNLLINANTYIHETGHLFGLDDYYDYDYENGTINTLANGFMMTDNYGDQDPYSKIILGWIEPTIIVKDGTYTINNYSIDGSCLLIPVDFNNSYFSEYILIDLFSYEGLDEIRNREYNLWCFDELETGVRVYYIASQLVNNYDEINNNGNITKFNNTDTKYALIRLLEADGNTDVGEDEYYFTTEDDLWLTGDSLQEINPSLTSTSGYLMNFDFKIISISNGHATIKVTFLN